MFTCMRTVTHHVLWQTVKLEVCLWQQSLSVCAKRGPWFVVHGVWHTHTNPHGRLSGHSVTLWPLHIYMLYV